MICPNVILAVPSEFYDSVVIWKIGNLDAIENIVCHNEWEKKTHIS